ncbi:MAG TPA: sulfite exporter TauE/SafE family protein [Gemmatimonadales bacterium]|nr:sulfite exporter TauE/SafE family protein [Gemmatimonadales bacterium]
MNPKTLLFLALGAVTVWFLAAWRWRVRATRAAGRLADDPPVSGFHAVVGFVMCFFDTLGIGNFATTTSMFKLKRSVRDEWIPGTLNVAYTLPTVAQAFIYISIVRVDFLTLVLMIATAVAGAWLGAGVVARWPRMKVQVGMGFALLAAAGLMLLTQLQLVPVGGVALALRGSVLVAGLVGNFALGALMTLGIGLYAPCLILVSLLGMDPRAAFPIMMGSCAFLMPIAGMRFIREGSYSLRASVVLALAGIPAVLIAAYIVKQMPLQYVRWLVVVVVVYAAGTLLRSALVERRAVE